MPPPPLSIPSATSRRIEPWPKRRAQKSATSSTCVFMPITFQRRVTSRRRPAPTTSCLPTQRSAFHSTGCAMASCWISATSQSRSYTLGATHRSTISLVVTDRTRGDEPWFVLIATVSDASCPTWRARSLSVYRFWRDLGYAIGALSAGLIADLFGMIRAIGLIRAPTFVSGMIVVLVMTSRRGGQ